MSEKKAALSTWTGHMAVRHGFTRVVRVEESQDTDRVEVVFGRPFYNIKPRLNHLIRAVNLDDWD